MSDISDTLAEIRELTHRVEGQLSERLTTRDLLTELAHRMRQQNSLNGRKLGLMCEQALGGLADGVLGGQAVLERAREREREAHSVTIDADGTMHIHHPESCLQGPIVPDPDCPVSRRLSR
jgi:hypothetical protein